MLKDVEVVDDGDDAIFIPNPDNYGLQANRRTFVGLELGQEIIRLMGGNGNIGKRWINDGVECGVLSPGITADWRKGKIYLRFVFVPDEEPPTAVVQGELVAADAVDDEVKQLPSSPDSDSGSGGTE